MHGEVILHHVKNMYRLDDATVQQFCSIVKFDISSHHIYIQPRQRVQCQKLQTSFIMSKEEIQEIINQWPKEWRVLVSEEQIQQ